MSASAFFGWLTDAKPYAGGSSAHPELWGPSSDAVA